MKKEVDFHSGSNVAEEDNQLLTSDIQYAYCKERILGGLFKFDRDRSTMHPRFDPTRVQSMTSFSRIVHFISLKSHHLNHSTIRDLLF